MTTIINSQLITLRDFVESDIKLFLDYIYHSPSGFTESIAIDLKKMPEESIMESGLADKCKKLKENPLLKSTWLTIMYDQAPIGFHTIDNLTEGESGIFHAHIWNPQMRQHGIARHSYPMACKIFFNRFNLKRIIFKTPIQNTGAIKVKEKLGIRIIGEETISFGAIKDGTMAIVFELTRIESEKMF